MHLCYVCIDKDTTLLPFWAKVQKIVRALLRGRRGAGRSNLGRKFRERKMTRKLCLAAAGLAAFGLVEAAHAETNLTIATVNNGDMIRMQRLTDDFSKANPDIKLNWVTLWRTCCGRR